MFFFNGQRRKKDSFYSCIKLIRTRSFKMNTICDISLRVLTLPNLLMLRNIFILSYLCMNFMSMTPEYIHHKHITIHKTICVTVSEGQGN